MVNPLAPGVRVRKVGEREYALDLKQGQTALLTPNGFKVDPTITAVAPQKEWENYYGVH